MQIADNQVNNFIFLHFRALLSTSCTEHQHLSLRYCRKKESPENPGFLSM